MNTPFDVERPHDPKTETWLWLAQRVSAGVLGVCVVVHLATIIMAVRGGLTAQEIIDRVTAHEGWLVFYAVFVLAAAVHAPIGVRNILNEMTALSRGRVDLLSFVFAALLAVLGMRAVMKFHGVMG